MPALSLTLMSVSYKHLDVYKRQDCWKPASRALLAGCAWIETPSGTGASCGGPFAHSSRGARGLKRQWHSGDDQQHGVAHSSRGARGLKQPLPERQLCSYQVAHSSRGARGLKQNHFDRWPHWFAVAHSSRGARGLKLPVGVSANQAVKSRTPHGVRVD